MTHRRVPHWVAMAQSLAGGYPGGLWAQLKHSVDPEDAATRGCQITAFLVADQ